MQCSWVDEDGGNVASGIEMGAIIEDSGMVGNPFAEMHIGRMRDGFGCQIIRIWRRG